MNRRYIYLIMLILLIIYGCGSDAPGTNPKADISLAFDLPGTLSQTERENLQAEISIDDDPAITLTVDNDANTASGSLGNITGGSHTFTVTYFIITDQGKRIDLAAGDSTIDIKLNEDNNIRIENITWDIDDDKDGFTNLAEYRFDTDTNNGNDKPTAELPRRSVSYTFEDSIIDHQFSGEVRSRDGRIVIKDML